MRHIWTLLLALPLSAQVDYFPLQVGNTWVYNIAGRIPGEAVVIDIPRSDVFNGQTYYQVRGFAEGTVYLRMSGSTLLAYDAETRQDVVWAQFDTPEGGTYRTAINPCTQMAKVNSRNARVKTPVGEYPGALAISYPAANCADAGLSSDVFYPYVGLIQREAITIAGPRVMNLIYSRTGGVTVLSTPEHAFSVSLDKTRYGGGDTLPVMMARITLRNTEAEPIELQFAGGQYFDVVVKDMTGKEALRWSEGKAFTMALVNESVTGERNWVAVLPLAKDGSQIPPGKYIAEVYLNLTGPRTYIASTPFEVVAAR